METDSARRRFLTRAAVIIGAAGLAGTAVPFIASMRPSARARTASMPVEVDISRLEPAQQLTVEWRGKAVWVLRRTPETLVTLPRLRRRLRDPDSRVETQQPPHARNGHRSIKPEYLVLVGVCTHLKCIPSYRPERAPGDLGPDWPGGCFCPCHGSRFDLAGRVFKGVPAPANLVVPPHRYLEETVVQVGVHPE